MIPDQYSPELKALLEEVIVSYKFAAIVSDKIDTTTGEAFRFIKNNINAIFEKMYKTNQPASIVIPELIRTQP